MNPPTRLYMTMPLDGFIAGPDDHKGQELGRDGGRLFNWLDDRLSDGPSGQVFREAMAIGAVISGRRTFELAGLLDELEIHVVPVLLGEGRPLFGSLGPGHTELDLVRVLDAPGVLHLRYRVQGAR